MVNNTKALLLTLPLVATGLVFGQSAEAASLTGPGTIDFNGSVLLSLVANGPGTADDELDFEFIPSGTNPNVAILNPGSATGGFSGFGVGASILAPNSGELKDITTPLDVPPGGLPLVLSDFLRLNNPGTTTFSGTSFNLERIGELVFTPLTTPSGDPAVGIATTVSGHWVNGLGGVFGGTIAFTAQVDNRTVAEVRDLIANGDLPQLSFSAEGVATIKDVPEPSAVLALMSVFGASVMLKKGKKAE